MKQSKDPFEVALNELEESPANSPCAMNEIESHFPAGTVAVSSQQDAYVSASMHFIIEPNVSSSIVVESKGKAKEDDDEDEEDNMDVELGKFQSSGDPDKLATMQAILSQFTDQQMSRYESFRRSGFQKANMKKLLGSLTGSSKISVPMTIVVSGIAKMFVGELVETGRMIMSERMETGPIRPCHIREAYRRLKLESKVPRRSVSRLFR